MPIVYDIHTNMVAAPVAIARIASASCKFLILSLQTILYGIAGVYRRANRKGRRTIKCTAPPGSAQNRTACMKQFKLDYELKQSAYQAEELSLHVICRGHPWSNLRQLLNHLEERMERTFFVSFVLALSAAGGEF
ncbi:MAG: hypothetical protein AAGF25_09340 [Pseudomonadota bacterium]